MDENLAPGMQEENDLRSGGFADSEISQWKGQTYQDLQKGGFGDDEIKQYFGASDDELSNIKTHFTAKAKDPTQAPGRLVENDLRNAGAPEDAISNWKNNTYSDMKQAGAQDQDVKDYFGVQDPDMGPLKNLISNNLLVYNAANEDKPTLTKEGIPKDQKPAKNFLEAFEAGLQISTAGLGIRGQMPTLVLPSDADRAMNIASQIGTVAGDIPAMVAGGLVFGAAGAAAGTIEAPVLGTVGLGAVGAGAGAFALPQALRKIMMDHYKKGDIKDASDFADRLMATTWEAVKGGVTGGLTALVGPAAEGLGGPLAKFGSELATMTTVSKAMEGKLPNADDFINGAIVLGGLHAATGVSAKLGEVYTETNEQPHQMVDASETDTVLKQDLLSENKMFPETQKIDADNNAAKPFASNPDADIPEQFEKPQRISDITNSKYDSTDRSDDEKAILGRIGEQVKPTNPETTAEEAYRNLIDDLNPVKIATTQLSEGKDISPSDDPYKLARTYKDWQGKLERTLKFNTIDFEDGKVNGEGLAPIMKDIDDLDGFKAYAIAKRAIEKESQGVTTGVPMEAADRVVEAGSDTHEANFRRLVDFQNRMVQYAVDSGILSEKSSESMKRANEDYIPFYRIQDADPFESETGTGGKLFQRMKGSESQLADPIQSIYQNTAAIFRRAEKNRVTNALVDLSNSSEQGDELLRQIPSTLRPIDIQEGEVNRFLKAQGVQEGEISPEGFTIFRPKSKNLADNEFENYVDGERQVYATKPELADAINGLDQHVGLTNMWANIFLKGPASLLRAGTVLSPDFILRHFQRSQMVAGMQSKYSQVPFVDSLQAIGNMWKEDSTWQEFLSSGGATGSFMRVNDLLESKPWETSREAGGVLDKTWNLIKSPIQGLSFLAELSDNAARLAEFKKGGGVGGTMDEKVDAAYNAREVTLDYMRAGAKVRAASAIIPFMNVGIQGAERTVRAFQENPTEMTAKVTSMITIPTILNYWANKDDSRYKDAPNWEKDLFWIVPTDKWETATSPGDYSSRPDDLKRIKDGQMQVNNGVTYRISKPFEIGVLFGSLPERMLDAYFGKNPNAMKGFGETVMRGLVPNLIPTFLSPVLEQASNHSFFTGNQIVSSQTEKFLPAYQYGSYTSETAKQIGKLISYIPGSDNLGFKGGPTMASPEVVDNYIRAWTGTLGGYALQIADKGLHALGIGDTSTKPTESLADTPFIKAFVMRYPQAKLQNVMDFQEHYKEADTVTSTVGMLAKSGDFDASQKLMNSNSELVMSRLAGVHQSLSTQSIFIQKILANKDMSSNDKRQLIDSAYYQMSAIADQGNKMIEQYNKIMKEK